MISDPISETSPKRRKLNNHGYDSQNDSGDDLFSDLPDTIPTQPLPESQRPGQPAQYATGHTFSTIMSSLNPVGVHNAPKRVDASSPVQRSSPDVQVARSSPNRYASTKQAKSLGTAMAPPGTSFRPPLGIARPVTSKPSDNNFEDPPIERAIEDDQDTDTLGAIKPTTFTKHVPDSPVQPSKPPLGVFSQYAYNSGQKAPEFKASFKPPGRRQAGPSPALPVSSSAAAPPTKMTLADIVDPSQRRKVALMQKTVSFNTVREIYDALQFKKGYSEDAMTYLLEQQEAMEAINDPDVRANVSLMRQQLPNVVVEALQNALRVARGDVKAALAAFSTTGNVIDLSVSDDETLPSPPPLAAANKAKQQLNAPAKSIHEKYSTVRDMKAGESSPKKAVVVGPSDPVATSAPGSSPVAIVKPRGRLIQRKKPIVQIDKSPSPVIHAERSAPAVIDSDGEMDTSEADEAPDEIDDPSSASNIALLKFINTCSALELADLANEKEEVANLILAQRPFSSLSKVREVGEAESNTKKSRKRPIGDKVMDVCRDMWVGYEAVDNLVKKCEGLGEPLRAAMKDWGLDLSAATNGELAATRVDEAHDSGIGTPTSTVTIDDDNVVTKRKGHAFLKQPSLMSKDLTMKDYQVFGLNWLNLLWSKRLSCILADDMGLGKTCQVISFLAHLSETGVRGTHLVIVPGSTLENWLREFNRFCPKLQVQPYYGSLKDREAQRQSIEEQIDEIDVIVTTYDTAASQKVDNRFLRKIVKPKVCVYDEGHALKNSSTKRHQELMHIPAVFRVLLTGTPLQNNLQEMVSLLNFILPQIFEEQREPLEAIFKYKASTRDTDHAALLSAQRIQRARSMMTPFVLRRKKQHVLKDLPSKTRRVEYCDMVEGQKTLWEQSVNAMKQAQTSTSKARGKVSSNHMMTLRQAALHPLLIRRIYTDDKLQKLQNILLQNSKSEFIGNRPDLVWKYLSVDIKGGDFGLHKFCDERADYIPQKYVLTQEQWMQSGKVQKLKELTTEFIANGDRILLFSQFTSMMDILEAVFETLSIKFLRLDGSTQMAQRQDMIDQFEKDLSIPLFMLSTKAGGAGINLACANKVIIFDSSFNPQDDIQAENRAHRVGQTREVEVVRLVTRGTIEEMIHALGESKLALDERVAADAIADDAQASKDGEKAVEQMFLASLSDKTT